MCGICGFTGGADAERLLRMARALEHRGPDDSGFWSTADVSLGSRRLSIVDLDTGQQPMCNEDESIWVVFNGEVYNHVELRAELIAAGHRFRSDHSDTEVLVHLYEEEGPDYLRLLNGMFAIALWDGRTHELHLGRDHTGIKPLFFAVARDQLVFGSEIKSVLHHPDVDRTPDFAALHHYFSFKNTPAPLTAFRGIQQLRPGERLVWHDGRLERVRWWRPRPVRVTSGANEVEAAGHIRELLTDSVRLRLRADVPVGAYLSGGVDSSSVVALASQIGGQRVKTFSLVYENAQGGKDEDRRFALELAEQYGTEHFEYVMTANEVVESLPEVVAAFDEPFSGVTSTYFLTRLIAQHVKVALSGDGADELFGSYLPHRLARPLAHYADVASRQLTSADRGLLEPFADRTDDLRRLVERGDEAARRMAQYLWDEDGKAALYTPRMHELIGTANTEALVRDLYAASPSIDPLNRALEVDLETLLPDQVLAFVDRLSMAYSVEVRPPFLDHRLIEAVISLPGDLKIKGGRVKHILKEAVRGLVPDAVIDRRKEGFLLPLNDWLLGPLRGLVHDTLTPVHLSQHGLLRQEVVSQLVNEFFAGQAGLGPRVWNILMFQMWWERYAD